MKQIWITNLLKFKKSKKENYAKESPNINNFYFRFCK